MATKKKTTKKSASQNSSKAKKESGGIFDYFRLSESYASLLLGLVVVIIAAVLLVTFVKNRNVPESDQDISATSTVNQQDLQAVQGRTYVVQAGDDLWKISQRVYTDGSKWVLIARANNISNPGMIVEGQKIFIPRISPTQIAQASSPTPTLSPSLTSTPTPTLTPTPTSIPTPTPTQIVTPTRSTATPTLKPDVVKPTITQSSYTVVHGDSLWDISVRAYGNGYKWVEIARANNLSNPDVIHSGNVLKLPR